MSMSVVAGVRWAGLAALAWVGVVQPALAGEDVAFAGRAVRRDVTDSRGNRFAVTVKPPADRAVDTRFFDAIEVIGEGEGTLRADSATDAGEPVDVSGYVVEVERLSAAATCTTQVTLKTKPVSLGGKKTFQVTSSTPPIYVAVTTFPKSGNVDALVLNGSTACNSSTKGAGNLDNAFCVSSNCTGSGNLTGQIKNPASAAATYVAAINMVFQAP